MYQSVRERLKDGVKQEILTNYYLNKYDKFMNKNNQQYSSNLNRSIGYRQRQSQSQRKNFKHLLMARKGYEKSPQKPQRSLSSRKKNFKSELQDKKSGKKEMKENLVNFLKLQSSIINELYSPSPSKLESGHYKTIQIRHKTQYEDKHSHHMATEEEDPIEIREFDEKQEQLFQENQTYQIKAYQHELELAKISEAIKSRFQKRSRSKKSSPTKSPKMIHSPNNYRSVKFPPKTSNISISLDKNDSSPEYKNQFLPSEQHLHQEEESEENVRQIFQQMDKQIQRKQYRPPTQKAESINSSFHEGVRSRSKSKISLSRSLRGSRISTRFQHKQSDKRSVYSRQSHYSRHSRFSESKQSERSPESFDDSLNQILPRIPIHQKEEMQQYDQRQELQSSQEHPSTSRRASTHELSMLSRFTMTNDEGTLIREDLQKQLNENEFGPYQNALANLMQLIYEYPNAWPIFVVGQRILEDRKQYDEKRINQNEELLRLQNKILKEKRQLTRRQKEMKEKEKKQREILRLVRRLSDIIY